MIIIILWVCKYNTQKSNTNIATDPISMTAQVISETAEKKHSVNLIP